MSEASLVIAAQRWAQTEAQPFLHVGEVALRHHLRDRRRGQRAVGGRNHLELVIGDAGRMDIGDVRPEQVLLVELGDTADLRRGDADMHGDPHAELARHDDVGNAAIEGLGIGRARRETERHERMGRREVLLLDIRDVVGRVEFDRRDRDARREDAADA